MREQLNREAGTCSTRITTGKRNLLHALTVSLDQKMGSRFGKKQYNRNYLVFPIHLALQYHTPPAHFPLFSSSEPPVSCASCLGVRDLSLPIQGLCLHEHLELSSAPDAGLRQAVGGQQRGQAHGVPAVATGTLLGLLQVGWDGCGGAEPRPSQAPKMMVIPHPLFPPPAVRGDRGD